MTCGKEAGEGAHTHTENCYKKTLICEKEEHTHNDACYETRYTITLKDGDTVLATITQVAGSAVTRPADPTKEGYQFAGWKLPEGFTDFPATMPEADIVIEAVWLKLYTLAFVDGETMLATITQPAGTAVTPPADPVKEGYAFAGWALPEGVTAFPTTMPEADLIIKATWLAKITAIDPLGEIYITYKPTIQAALALMWPNTTVTLSDGTKVAAALTWTKDSCPKYDEKEGDGKYTFTAVAVTTAAANPLADGVKLPTCTMVVGPGTYSDEYADYTFRLNEAMEVTITKCVPKLTDVVVPEKIGECPVTYIGAEAFKKCETLVRVILPKGLLAIGDKAFAGCEALESLVVPDSLQAVGLEMFKNVKTLVSLTLCTDLDSTLAADDTVVHTLIVEEQEVPCILEMPMAFTDIIANTGTFTIDCDYTVATDHAIAVNPTGVLNVAAERTLKNLGIISNNGAIGYSGKIVTCGGTWMGSEPIKQKGGAFVTSHIYEKGICTGCGAKEEVVVTQLTISYIGSGLDKVYDKTRNVTVTGSDFRISGTRSDHTNVRITGIRAAYDSADVGDRKITISFTLGGDDEAWYTCDDITVSAKITPKPLIITPTEGQKKFYGAADPTYFTGTVKGLLQGDSITGRLSRDTGEDVGKYKIVKGTIDAGTNYEVQVQEAYFVIEAKSINSTDVGLVTIGNQKYTGQPIKPTITLRYGTLTLKQDTDFKAEYTDNTKVGTAKVKMTGIGNYTGERETSFRILDVSDEGGGGGSGGGSDDDDDDDDDFGEGSDEFEDEDEDEDEDDDTGKLILDDVDYGDVLIGQEGNPQPFTYVDEADGLGKRVLTIMPDPMMDEATGDSLFLDEDNMRERFSEMHLRISTTLAKTLADKGISEIVYQLDQADVHIPLASLVAELPLDAPDPDAAGEGVAATDDAGEMEVAPQALQVSAYDICLEQVDAIRLTNAETREALIAEGALPPEPEEEGEAAEEPAEGEADDAELQVDPRVAALLLSEREVAQLDDYQAKLMVPAYRLRVRVILEGQEPEITGLKDDNGEPLPQMVPKALPEGVYPKDITMALMPDETPQGETDGIRTIRAAVLNTPWDPDEVAFAPTAFEDVDGMTYAMVALERDGLYAVNDPSIPDEDEEDYVDDGFDDDDDEVEFD